VFSELKSLMVKSAGVGDVLGEALAPLAEQIQAAFLYGSLARGGGAESDVNVMVNGDASFSDVVSALQPAQEVIGREVNPSVYSAKEFSAKLRAKHHFLSSVMAAPKVFLAGSENELKRLAKSLKSVGRDLGLRTTDCRRRKTDRRVGGGLMQPLSGLGTFSRRTPG
jgi:predicted nucleotidyltransferase